MSAKASRTKHEATEEPSEYERFEEFATKLVRVPKKEIDAERAKANGKKPKK